MISSNEKRIHKDKDDLHLDHMPTHPRELMEAGAQTGDAISDKEVRIYEVRPNPGLTVKQAIQNALEFLEVLGYTNGGDIHDDLALVLSYVRRNAIGDMEL